MWQRMPYNPGPYDDDWEDQPGQGPFYQWFMGAALPLAILISGVVVIVRRQATFGSGEVQPMHLEGPRTPLSLLRMRMRDIGRDSER